MSLLSESMEPCTYIDKITRADGYGGVDPHWQPGAQIQAAIVLDNSLEARMAEKDGLTSLYTIITSKAVRLPYGQIIRRDSDGRFFRVTSDGTDRKTPPSASLDMRAVSAEKLDALPDW